MDLAALLPGKRQHAQRQVRRELGGKWKKPAEASPSMNRNRATGRELKKRKAQRGLRRQDGKERKDGWRPRTGRGLTTRPLLRGVIGLDLIRPEKKGSYTRQPADVRMIYESLRRRGRPLPTGQGQEARSEQGGGGGGVLAPDSASGQNPLSVSTGRDA